MVLHGFTKKKKKETQKPNSETLCDCYVREMTTTEQRSLVSEVNTDCSCFELACVKDDTATLQIKKKKKKEHPQLGD